MSEEQESGPDTPTHSKTCPECGGETYDYERYCHLCNADTWEATA